MSEFLNDWLPYIVLVVTHFSVSVWIARRKQRREAAQIKETQDSMIADYNRRHKEAP